MIPVEQTKFVVKNSEGKILRRGNCFAAAIASYLELPITEVPNIEVLYDLSSSFYMDVLQKWLLHKGYEISCDGDIPRRDYYLVTGPSSRGVLHIVVYKGGKMVHDPHPSKEGLTKEEHFWTIKPVR